MPSPAPIHSAPLLRRRRAACFAEQCGCKAVSSALGSSAAGRPRARISPPRCLSSRRRKDGKRTEAGTGQSIGDGRIGERLWMGVPAPKSRIERALAPPAAAARESTAATASCRRQPPPPAATGATSHCASPPAPRHVSPAWLREGVRCSAPTGASSRGAPAVAHRLPSCVRRAAPAELRLQSCACCAAPTQLRLVPALRHPHLPTAPADRAPAPPLPGPPARAAASRSQLPPPWRF